MTGQRNPPASPPCSLQAWQDGTDGSTADDVRAWRHNERQRLRRLRRAIREDDRLRADEEIGRRLDALIREAFPPQAGVASPCIAVYWPLAGEPALQEWYAVAAARGQRLALPVVVERRQALRFRRWRPGDALHADVLGIPVPEAGTETKPDIIVAPCVGFDERCYRLGNGGGYYDRTFGHSDQRPLLLGVGYEVCALRSIYPQAHDIPMDAIVTESGQRAAEPSGQAPVSNS